MARQSNPLRPCPRCGRLQRRKRGCRQCRPVRSDKYSPEMRTEEWDRIMRQEIGAAIDGVYRP